ncbi:MAG: SAM-dependent methyltransferase [Acidobacteria bacterium]|nr:MAG: SAM-dependent methyltransferase [Acidobacteriota bacterium]
MNRIHRWLCASAAWKKALDQQFLPWVLDGIDLGGELLEVGPGPGLTTEFLRRRVERIAAVEIDARLAESLGRRMANTNVGVVRGDATRLPFRDASFSAAVALTMLHHVPSEQMQDRLLGEVCRVLRPNGIFAGMDSTVSLLLRLLHLGDTMVLVDPDSFGARLQRAGFAGAMVMKAGGRFRFLAVRPS